MKNYLRIYISAEVGGGGSGVVQWAAERKPHGTREDKKAGGDAEAAAREGGDEAAAQGPEGSGSTREVFVRPAPAVVSDEGECVARR